MQISSTLWEQIVLYPAELSLRNEGRHTAVGEPRRDCLPLLISSGEIREDLTEEVLFEFPKQEGGGHYRRVQVIWGGWGV